MTDYPDTWRKPPFIRNSVLRRGLWVAISAYVVFTMATLPIDWDRVAAGMGRAAKIFGGAFPPPALPAPIC